MKGYASLLMILILSAVLLGTVLSGAILSVEESRVEWKEEQAATALSLATFCGEVALMKLESVFQYGGDETLSAGDESCAILPIEGAGNRSRVVKTESKVDEITKRIRIEVDAVSPEMKIRSWEQVTNF